MTRDELHDLADKGFRLYAVTRDPLTLSAAKILNQSTTARLNQPQLVAIECLQRQLSAYHALYVDPL